MWSVLCFLIVILVSTKGFPASLVETLTADKEFKDVENSIGPPYDDDEFSEIDVYVMKSNASKSMNYTNTIIPFTTTFEDKNETAAVTSQLPLPLSRSENHVTKLIKRLNATRNSNKDLRNSLEEKASQEQDSSEEEGGMNVITGLLSAFLSGLSRADGSIDLDAIVGLLGSLSTQNTDGTFDFSGLSDLLQSFFGGGDDGGGSDIGAFVGGLLGALIRGVANPPGAKGAGILAGKVVTGVLPALSGPAPMDNSSTTEPQLDSGSFLTGFLKTFLASSGSGGNGMGGSSGSKYTVFKLLVSTITGLFSSASSLSSSSKSDWNN